MVSPLVVPFPGGRQASRSEVGGKAVSLLRMCEAGLPVPPGAVLTTRFFSPWLDEVEGTTAWAALIGSPPDAWPPLCAELQERALRLVLTPTQRAALNELLREVGAADDGMRFAVRSSSPEEDLASASFAGGYETRLGVRAAGVEDAVRACFASGFGLRALVYGRERGFGVRRPRMAVVVQRQLDSEVSGIGFSLNPVTNDYDEAVIDANLGLGTSVVEGRVSPDHFVVDRVSGEVVQEIRGERRVSTWLAPGGGTFDREDEGPAERTLTDARLCELTEVLGRIERLYGTPVDVEWAYAGGRLHLLQARPITTFVPLPPEMVTAPGERRRLYGDAALSKGLTTNTPISPLGLDAMERMFRGILESRFGASKTGAAPGEALFFCAGGRMYVDYSGMLWLASPAKLARSAAPTDALTAEILAAVDPGRYRAASRPRWVSIRLLLLAPRALWSLRGFFRNLLRTFVSPERAHRAYRRRVGDFAAELREQLDGGLPLDELRRTYQGRLAREVFDVAMPALLAGMIPPRLLVRGRGPEALALAERLTLGSPDNVVVEMGIALHRLATLLDPADLEELDGLAGRIEERRMPAAFLDAWDDFLSRFGWRGPMEMDLASPRYADDPRLALRQMAGMAGGDERFDPGAAHRRLVDERRQAYDRLARSVGPLRRALLRRVHRLAERFGGARDTPKHLIVLFNYAIRKRVLAEGRRLAGEGRLDAEEDVFWLTFDELEAAARDEALDLREAFAERRRFHGTLKVQVSRFPAMIDSRGRILRPPPRDDAPGLLRGMPVSPGVVRGAVRVLHSPRESVAKGDVLVAYTTDPGWTPLFVNAAAIVLEVGGTLQHGAVVAREYGKPCVVGIDQVVSKLRDGALVEVDGTMGTVRLLGTDGAGAAPPRPDYTV